MIDNAMLAYNNRPLTVPKALQGSGIRVMSNEPVDKNSELYKQALEFESIFVEMMLKEMRATVHKGDMMNGGHAEDIFEDMLYQERAKDMSKTAGFGLADTIYRELNY
ncbi:MAG: rod-binding protein [Spirochaetes bacterium]|nr:rod-binding protein [Spirochaetota bacterium]MBU0953955.1 rod-binding protein [Spirochaetota bacterium]